MKDNRAAALKHAQRLVDAIHDDEGARLIAKYVADRLSRPMSTILARVPGKSVIEKARAAGVSRQSFYSWLKGETRPSGAQAQVLAKLTGYSVEEIRGSASTHAPPLPRLASPTLTRRRKSNSDNLAS